jgi:hypothetical protein
MRLDKTLTAAGLALALALSGGAAIPALAQDAPAPASEATSYSDDKLQSFVGAAIAVSDIQREAVASLENVEDEAQQQTLVEEANAKMEQAIESTDGITLDEYVEVATAAEQDPALRERLETIMVASMQE